ncbi:23S rRNA (uracil(747)-C(5))-methyltransferase RlmC [Demequina sp.]|uniref:23S rRNA (uracil(747)-C(5))-methyltransferase RlmC n=1 Tax=Demequina sp. TaxID=2050685 RepID=UPI0025BA3E38|nr:23S rRNA (uracil(747)-C(5))-methyltransferase RlmC [Demequina sp.]
MDCLAYDSGRCRSCTLIETPYARQVASKQDTLERLLREALGDAATSIEWQPPMVGPESGFRTKAKMVVAGTVDQPTVGILDADGHGVDLRDCPLYDPTLTAAFPALSRFVSVAGLQPYSVPERRGELKHIIVTTSPSGELMARFVVRSTEPLARMRKHLAWLQGELPALTVVTVNVLPEHRAVMEGEREIVLTEQAELHMALGTVDLRLRPQSFFQTNTDMARALYAHVAQWVAQSRPRTVWDLYCGVGGFALHCLARGRAVTGVESSEQAVLSARDAASDMAARGVAGADEVRFVAADATLWASAHDSPDVVIVNPPRRGIGADLARWLESSRVPRVVYSSCNAVTLARDLAAMPSLVPVEARLFDMFPQTAHFEAVVLLERAAR